VLFNKNIPQIFMVAINNERCLPLSTCSKCDTWWVGEDPCFVCGLEALVVVPVTAFRNANDNGSQRKDSLEQGDHQGSEALPLQL
jgi:hypothetical protein